MKKSVSHYLLVLSTFLLATTAQAQTYGRFGHLAAGFDGVKVGAVNDWMPPQLGYPVLKDNMLGFSVDQYVISNNLLVGIQLQSKVGRVVRSRTGNMRPYVFDAMAQVGYIVVHKRKLMVYPTLGAGYGGFGAHIFNTKKRYPDFVPSEPRIRENVVLINRGFVGSIAISADFFVRKQLTERDKGLIIGLRAGYDYRPESTRWQANGKLIAGGGPSFAATGPFIRLLVGTGNIGPKQQ